MAASYLEASLDRLGAPAQRDDTIEICINPDGRVWGEFQGDHFMRGLGTPLTQTSVADVPSEPNTILLYREAILLEWIETGEDLFRLVRNVLIHEIGHQFGLSDEDIERLEREG